MAEDLAIITGSKAEQYQSLIPQIKGLLDGEPDLIANMANLTAALKEQFGWLWVGFYIVKKDELVLAPFQGPVACTRIKKGRGVCGSSWAQSKTLIVPDVEKFPGHIACSSLSKSEIVVPVYWILTVANTTSSTPPTSNTWKKSSPLFLSADFVNLFCQNLI